MELSVGRLYHFAFAERGACILEVMVESRSGKLNTQTGEIVTKEELDEVVLSTTINKMEGKSMQDIPGLAFLPDTLEVIVSRIWEWIDEGLGYKARLSRLKLQDGRGFFAVYDGRQDRQAKRRKEQQSEEQTSPQSNQVR